MPKITTSIARRGSWRLASRGVRRALASPRRIWSAWWRTAIMTFGLSGEEGCDHVPHAFKEVRFLVAEPLERAVWATDEGAQHPRHLRADKSKHDHPHPEDRLYVRPQHMLGDFVERTKPFRNWCGLIARVGWIGDLRI